MTPTTTGNSVTVTVDVAVDPDTAFAVFTDEIDAWYQRGPYSFMFPEKTVAIRFEPGPGGRLLEVHDAASGEGFEFGRVVVWEPGSRLVFTDLVSSTPPDPVTEVEVTFEPIDAGTRVTLEHRGLDHLPPAVAAQKREHGWAYLVAWFREHLERGTA